MRARPTTGPTTAPAIHALLSSFCGSGLTVVGAAVEVEVTDAGVERGELEVVVDEDSAVDAVRVFRSYADSRNIQEVDSAAAGFWR